MPSENTEIPYKNEFIWMIQEFVVTATNSIEVEWRSWKFPEYVALTTIKTMRSIDWSGMAESNQEEEDDEYPYTD